MAEQQDVTTTPKADIALLLSVVRARFVNMDSAESNAIVLAIEGLRWLLGTDSAVSRTELEQELAYWEQHSVVSVAREWPEEGDAEVG